MQYCLQLTAATSALEDHHAQLLAQQQQVQQQQQQGQAAAPAAAQSSSTQQQQLQPAVTSAVVPASVARLADLAQQLQQDLTVLSSHHKQLHTAAARICSAFRAGGSIIRARALELGASMERHCAAAAASAGALPAGAGKASAVAVPGSFPLVVAAAVVQHWNDVEMLLAALHSTCETMLPELTNQTTHVQGDVGQLTAAAAGLQQRSSDCGTAARRRALKACRRLVDGLQQLLPAGQGCDGSHHAAHQPQQHLKQQMEKQQREQHQKQQEELFYELNAGRAAAAAADSSPDQSRTMQQQQQQHLALRPSNHRPLTDQQSTHHVCHNTKPTHDTTPPLDVQQHTQVYVSPGGRQSAAQSNSSCSEGLGQLLSALQAQMAAAAAAAPAAPAAGTAAGAGASCAAERSHVAVDRGYDLEGSSSSKRPARTARGVKTAGARAALFGNDQLDGIDQQCQQQQQQQGHCRKKAEGRTQAAGASAAAQSLGQAGGVGQADEAMRASIRRVERAALLEKIKLLQQHHQGRSLSQG